MPQPRPGIVSIPPPVPTVNVAEPFTLAAPAPLPVPLPDTNTSSVAASPLSVLVSPTSPVLLEPAPGTPWPKEWANVWLPLESWGKFNGLAKPVQLTGGADALFEMQTTNGPVLLKMGSQTASLGGLDYGLGFAPRLIRGLPYIHSLDAQKTLQVAVGSMFPLPAGHRTVVIDAGHGGRDSGARSVIGRDYEKDLTLDWALRLRRRLEGTGWNVVLTRTNDMDLSLSDRVAIADRAEADLFISLHLNSGSSNHDLAGVETYCLTPTGMPSNLLRQYEDDPREAYPNNRYDEQNVQLATRLHRTVLQSTGAADRGVRRARFMAVLRSQHRPAVLVEGGYITTMSEARKLATGDYRQALAEGVARALLE